MNWLQRAAVAVGVLACLATPALAEMIGGVPTGEVAPDVEITPLGSTPVLLSQIQGNKVFALFVFKST